MFNHYLGNVSLPVTAEQVGMQTWQPPAKEETPQVLPPAKQVPTMFFLATKSDQQGEIYLKVVNAIGSAQKVRVDLAGASKVGAEGKAIVLSSARKEPRRPTARRRDVHLKQELHRDRANRGREAAD